MTRFQRYTLSALALFGALLGVGRAQTPPAAPPATFPFVIPWDDAAPGTATDVSFLNVKPAGAHGFVVPRGGHFVESRTGTRVRFLGVNFAARTAFPSHADADKVAARLAKYGVNIVRLHHMDNDDWGADAHLWDDSYQDRRHISRLQLDKLDYLIAQLKKNGIYADLNLHVSRQFSPADGFPASVAQIPFGYDKRVDNYDRRMIARQKEYAQQLLTHVNPYTHLSYAQDPCVAVVEINNENSLMGDPWGAGFGTGLDTLPEPFRGELVGMWNDWLVKKYGTDAKLRAAWLQGVTPPGPPINVAAQWSFEDQGTSSGGLTIVSLLTGPDLTITRPLFAAPSVVAKVTQVDGTDWHVQAHQTGLDFKEGTTYTVSFRARADAPRPMPVAAGLDEADWHSIGLAATADLTTDWKTFRYTFEAQGVVPKHGRVALTLGGQTGTVFIADLQVTPGAAGAGLQAGQSLTARTVALPTSATHTQHADWLRFLADTERAYADEMRDYLKTDLHVHANVIDSQLGFGGLSSVYRETNSDFADAHAYWQHPSFPHKAWDSQDWTIPDTPMVADLASGGGGTLRDLAEYRIAGKPYSVSEYNHPAPSDYQAETVPLLATFAAFQDWDMIYLFDYGDYGAGVDNARINGFFGVGSNPAKWAFMPAAALIFRQSEMGVASSSGGILVSKHDLLSGVSPNSLWREQAAQKEATEKAMDDNSVRTMEDLNAYIRRFPRHDPAIFDSALSLELRGQPSVMYRMAAEEETSAPSVRVLKTPAGAQYIAESPNSLTVVGFVGGQTVMTKAATFTFPQFGNNFAAVTLTPLDHKPLTESHHLLLTLVGKVENQEMHWNAARTSIGDQWGHAPTMAEGIPMTMSFSGPLGLHMYALHATGKRTTEVPNTSNTVININGHLETPPVFTVGPQYQTVWYEIVE